MANGNGNENGKDHGNGHGEVDNENMKFAEFRKTNSPSFRGTFDLDTANEWIMEMEMILSILTCTEE